MAAIVDADGTLNLATLGKGVQENLPTYARPLFVRVLPQVQMTGRCSTCIHTRVYCVHALLQLRLRPFLTFVYRPTVRHVASALF